MKAGRARTNAAPPVRRQRTIGALMVLLTVVVLTLAYVRPNPFANDFDVSARFDDVTGMGVVGTEVRIDGAPVGAVVERRRDGDDAIVTMRLESTAGPIRTDATAELRPRIAFEGTAFIELHPGSAGAGRVGDSTLPLTQTRTYVGLTQALRFANRPTRAAVRADVGGLAAVLRGEGRRGLRATLAQAPRLVDRLAVAAEAARGPNQVELTDAVRGLSRTMSSLAPHRDDLVPLNRGAETTFAAINTDGGRALDRLLITLPPALRELRAGGDSLDRIVDRVQRVSRPLTPALTALTPALRETRPLLEHATPVLRDSSPFLADLRRTIDAAGRSAPQLRGALTALRPSLSLLNRSLLPALAKPTALGLPAYLQFASLFQGGGGASRPFQTAADGAPPQNMGSGHFMRFGARFFTGIGAPAPPCDLLDQVNATLAAQLAEQGLCVP